MIHDIRQKFVDDQSRKERSWIMKQLTKPSWRLGDPPKPIPPRSSRSNKLGFIVMQGHWDTLYCGICFWGRWNEYAEARWSKQYIILPFGECPAFLCFVSLETWWQACCISCWGPPLDFHWRLRTHTCFISNQISLGFWQVDREIHSEPRGYPRRRRPPRWASRCFQSLKRSPVSTVSCQARSDSINTSTSTNEVHGCWICLVELVNWPLVYPFWLVHLFRYSIVHVVHLLYGSRYFFMWCGQWTDIHWVLPRSPWMVCAGRGYELARCHHVRVWQGTYVVGRPRFQSDQ